ncbi:MAG: hypothetical protein AABW46_00920 [Nanoarchaeota archaeon]
MDSQVLIKHFWIVLAIVVFMIFFTRIEAFKSTDKDAFNDFKSDFYAKDIALLVNRMISSEADSIFVEYKLDVDFDAELDKNEVVIKYKNFKQSSHIIVGDFSKISFEKVAEGVLIKKNE